MSRVAITTKYLGPTDTKCSRVKAISGNGHSVTIAYDTDTTDEQAHRNAAEALRDKMGWPGHLVSGGTADGYAFVFVEA